MSQAAVLPRRAARRPAIPSPVLAVALFLFSEVMLFAGLASAFVVLRGQAAVWPPPGQPRLPIELTGFNTVLLLASGITMWLSVDALQRNEARRLRWWLGSTVVLGTAFLLLQGSEWTSLVAHGLTRASSLYASLFYTIVGCHGLHVLVALAVLAFVARGVLRGTDELEDRVVRLRAMRLYWLFVVAVWPPLYALVYLW